MLPLPIPTTSLAGFDGWAVSKATFQRSPGMQQSFVSAVRFPAGLSSLSIENVNVSVAEAKSS